MIEHATKATIIELDTETTTNVTLSYDEHDPFAIKFDFDGVKWIIGRDLLATGIAESMATKGEVMAGEGDVKLVVSPMYIWLHLSSPEGSALVRFATAILHQFLWTTFDVVESGKEDTTDAIDHFLASL